eukprot:5413605-Amphidinium_carterae.2
MGATQTTPFHHCLYRKQAHHALTLFTFVIVYLALLGFPLAETGLIPSRPCVPLLRYIDMLVELVIHHPFTTHSSLSLLISCAIRPSPCSLDPSGVLGELL